MAEVPASIRELDADELRRTCPPDGLGFRSTAEVEPLEGTVGQTARGRGDRVRTRGPDGRLTTSSSPVPSGPVSAPPSRRSLHEHARRRPTPGDWVYVHNFRDPRQPIAIALPGGHGHQLAADMRRFLEDARRDLAGAFESDTYARRRREATEPLEREQERSMQQLRDEALAGGIALELTPTGLVTVPLRDGHPITPADFAQLSETSAPAISGPSRSSHPRCRHS